MKNEILRMESVTTIQDEITLLDNFNLHIFQCEIMGLVCQNAIGEESLIQLISQNLPIHYGRVYFNETLVNNYQQSSLTLNKVAIIGRKSRLIQDLTVSDNVFVLRRRFKKYFIEPHVLNAQLKRFAEEAGVDIDGKELVSNLSAYKKYAVELLRAVIMGEKLIVIRDISNSVSAADLTKFHSLLRHYCQKGFSFLYICNHHQEAFKICSRVSLMKDGKIVKVLDQNEFQDEKIVPYYINEYADYKRVTVRQTSKKEILAFRNVNTPNLCNMSFSVAKGECTILLDMSGTILSDIMKLMNGQLRMDSGEIYLDNTVYTPKQARHAVQNGVTFIDENPVQTMLFHEMDYLRNLCVLIEEKQNPIHLSRRIMNSIIHEYEPIVGKDIYAADIMNLKLQSLYDLVYYRIHLCNPKIVFCVQPFSDADMYLRRHLIELINQLKKKGITVILLAVNIEDSLVVADKLIQLEKGQFSKEYSSSDFYLFHSEGITL